MGQKPSLKVLSPFSKALGFSPKVLFQKRVGAFYQNKKSSMSLLMNQGSMLLILLWYT